MRQYRKTNSLDNPEDSSNDSARTGLNSENAYMLVEDAINDAEQVSDPSSSDNAKPTSVHLTDDRESGGRGFSSLGIGDLGSFDADGFHEIASQPDGPEIVTEICTGSLGASQDVAFDSSDPVYQSVVYMVPQQDNSLLPVLVHLMPGQSVSQIEELVLELVQLQQENENLRLELEYFDELLQYK